MSNAVPETRKRILEATLHLLEASEGRDVRISDIAEQARVTRQTLYHYFKTRSELLVETTFYVDELYDTPSRLVASRNAQTGVARLEAYVTAWADYIQEIYGVARALISLDDPDANSAWRIRMQDMWEGCEAAIKALKKDGHLNPDYSVKEASDLLWTLMSVRNWEHLRIDREWSQAKYVKHINSMTKQLFCSQKAFSNLQPSAVN